MTKYLITADFRVIKDQTKIASDQNLCRNLSSTPTMTWRGSRTTWHWSSSPVTLCLPTQVSPKIVKGSDRFTGSVWVCLRTSLTVPTTWPWTVNHFLYRMVDQISSLYISSIRPSINSSIRPNIRHWRIRALISGLPDIWFRMSGIRQNIFPCIRQSDIRPVIKFSIRDLISGGRISGHNLIFRPSL